MKKVLWIFGDSFSFYKNKASWPNLLTASIHVNNYSTNGSSEYRIWKSYLQHKSKISSNDLVLFCHTSPSRIYLKNDVLSISRKLSSHLHCDILLNNVFANNETKFINLLSTIWDEEYFNDMYSLLVSKMVGIPNSIHVTFFEIKEKSVHNFHTLWNDNIGNINHLSVDGNVKVKNKLLELINEAIN